MCSSCFILADDDTGWLKFLPMFVVGAIWLLGIASSILKRTSSGQKTPIVPIAPFTPRRPDDAASVQRSATRGPRPIGRPGVLAKMRTDALFAARHAEALRQLVAGEATPAVKRREPVPPQRRQPSASLNAQAQPDAGPTAHRQAPSLVEGRALSRRMQPALLRYQFILTEILRPPVALREED